jgi:BON domain
MSREPTTDTAVATQPPTVIEQPAPAQQPPVIIQQPAPVTTQPAPIIVNPPAGGTMPTESTNIDSTIQAAIDKRLADDPEFSTLGITVSVIDGKAMVLGTVKTEELKGRIERAVKQIKGVKAVDNQITVLG